MKNSFGLTTLRKAQKVFPGLMMCVVVALAAKLICEHFGAPVMLMALLIGMAFNFLTEDYGKCLAGIEFSAKALLRIGAAFLGLGITLQQIATTGHEVLDINVGGVVLTIVCSLGLSRVRFGLLTGGAVATCGAPAALAISSVLQKNKILERDTVFTVIAVTAFSTMAVIIYPINADYAGLSEIATGVFPRETIHDVAQFAGAGYSVSDLTGETATFVKLLRVAVLVPIVLVLSIVFAETREPGQKRSLTIPFFVSGFSALVVAETYGLVPSSIYAV
ncbi:putative sulfate exporter family transporter [Ascidiaceihabitans sp.]|nr:putative sulfate exporter family transporter [Ascidiaceihabitans sp.]